MTVDHCYQNGALDISESVLGVSVSLSPLHKSIKEFRKAVLKVDSELKVSILLIAACCCLIHVFNFV
jgi:hypothetical protein